MMPTELKRQKPSGCDQGMGPLPATLYHHVLLRMEAHAKEGQDRRCLGFPLIPWSCHTNLGEAIPRLH